MASLAAERVAHEVLETIGKGKRANVYRIAIKNGYTPASASAGVVQNTLTYKRIIEPVVGKMEKVRNKIVDSLDRVDYDEIEPLARSVISKNLTHDIQLLSGKSTEHAPNEDKQIIINVLQLVRGTDNGSIEPYNESKTK